jgi:uncharacterized membrane protein
VLVTAFFYARLPLSVAYQFNADGSPYRLASRNTVVLLLLPQVFFTLLAAGMVWVVGKVLTMLKAPQSSIAKSATILPLMGNMVALPQALLCFAMLDIFSYNSYQVHLLPLWASAFVVIVVGGIVLVVFFIRAIRDIRGTGR